MSCEEIDELLGAHALDALSDGEARAAREHLSTCRRHDEALAGMEAAVSRLALAAPEREPAPQARARLLQAFDAEMAAQRAPRHIEEVREGMHWRFPIRPAYVYATAAVLVLAIAGLLSWNLALQFGGDGGNGGQSSVVAQFSGSIGAGQVVYIPNQKGGLMELNLQEPATGKSYQAWAIYDTGPVSLGLVPATGATAFRADLSTATAVAITEEPAGGSPLPTGDPLATAKLR